MRLLLLALVLPLSLASPLPAGGDFNDIEKRWAEGHSEVCAASAQLPECYVQAWIESISNLWSTTTSSLSSTSTSRTSQFPSEQDIHTGLTHRDMTPTWPMHAHDSDGHSFATATDERSIEASVLRTRTSSLMEQMKAFAERVMRSKGLDTVIARRMVVGEDEEMVPVLRTRKAMRYHFSAQ